MTVITRRRSGAIGQTAGIVVSALLASTALVIAVCREPLRPGFALRNPASDPLDNYQFDTPANAAKSMIQMEVNRDFRARMEYESRMDTRHMEERVKTFKVEKEVSFARDKNVKKKKFDGTGDYKILFVSFEQNGENIREIITMEKDPSGLWRRGYVGTYDVRPTNKELADEMDAWEGNGRPY